MIHSVQLFLINQLMWNILSYYKLVPDFIAREDYKDEEVKIMTAVISSMSINYNTFLSTAISVPLIVMPCTYIVNLAASEMRFDPYTKEPLAGDSAYISSQMSINFLIVTFVVINHYLCQKDLLSLTIEKFMIKRHQA